MEPKCYKCNQAYMHKEKISGYGYVCTCPNCGARYIVYQLGTKGVSMKGQNLHDTICVIIGYIIGVFLTLSLVRFGYLTELCK